MPTCADTGSAMCDDASNRDPQLARARLRQHVWGALTGAFENAESRLAASARRAHEANACVQELAAIDLAAVTTARGQLRVARWIELSVARRANALRAWLGRFKPDGVPETLLLRLLVELPGARVARWPLGDGQLRCFDGLLSFAPEIRATPAVVTPAIVDLSVPGKYRVSGWAGTFEVRRNDGGLAPVDLQCCTLRARRGGERLQRAPGSPPRSLKKQFQAARVPSWDRDGPLVLRRRSAALRPRPRRRRAPHRSARHAGAGAALASRRRLRGQGAHTRAG